MIGDCPTARCDTVLSIHVDVRNLPAVEATHTDETAPMIQRAGGQGDCSAPGYATGISPFGESPTCGAFKRILPGEPLVGPLGEDGAPYEPSGMPFDALLPFPCQHLFPSAIT